jgi:hypothetical protein
MKDTFVDFTSKRQSCRVGDFLSIEIEFESNLLPTNSSIESQSQSWQMLRSDRVKIYLYYQSIAVVEVARSSVQ